MRSSSVRVTTPPLNKRRETTAAAAVVVLERVREVANTREATGTKRPRTEARSMMVVDNNDNEVMVGGDVEKGKQEMKCSWQSNHRLMIGYSRFGVICFFFAPNSFNNMPHGRRARRVVAALLLAVVVVLMVSLPRASWAASSMVDMSKLMGHYIDEHTASFGDSDHFHRYAFDPMALLFREFRSAVRDLEDMQDQVVDGGGGGGDVSGGGGWSSIQTTTRRAIRNQAATQHSPSTVPKHRHATAPHAPPQLLTGRAKASKAVVHTVHSTPRSVMAEGDNGDDDIGIVYTEQLRQPNALSCSSVGVASGRKKNVCSRQNCLPTKVCKPDASHMPQSGIDIGKSIRMCGALTPVQYWHL
jgi:hypothetical protein